VVMACPFCSIMLKGAQASAGKSGAAGAADKPIAMTDLMSYVADRLPGVRDGGPAAVAPPAASPPERSGEPPS